MTDEFVQVASDHYRVVFWPGCGGRLISLAVDGVELLWRSPDFLAADGRLLRPRTEWPELDGTMGSWSNVGGSKTWPAPQGWSGEGEWPGPPDPVLDSGSWSVHVDRADPELTIVTMTSPVDVRSGLVVTRSFELPRSGWEFRQRTTFTNASDRPIRWSIWEVCQVDTSSCRDGGGIEVEVGDAAAPVVQLEAVGTVPLGELRDGVRRIPVTRTVGKLGFANATGRVGLTRPDGAGVSLCFEPSPLATYPDGGCQVELWLQHPIPEPLERFEGLHPQAWLVELEVLGPLLTLEPGASSEQSLCWRLSAPASVVTC